MTTEKKPVTKKSRIAAKRGTHLTTAERAEAIALWEAGTVTLEELEKRFGRSRTTFHRLFKTEGIVRGSKAKETEEKVKAAVEESVVSTAAIYAERVKVTKENAFKYSSMIQRITAAEIIRINREGRSYGSANNDLKALKTAMETFKMARQECYAALGLSENDAGEERPLPDLMIQEITIAEIREMTKSNRVGAEDGDFDFEDDLGDEDIITGSDDDRVETE